MSRTARCSHCGDTFTVATTTGPLPSVCDPCDPEAAAHRTEMRERNRDRYRERTAELAMLRRRVDELDRQLHAGRPERHDPRRPAGRDTVAIAVRRVGTAEGRHQTGERLRQLAAEALAWADALGSVETTPPPNIQALSEAA